jgi:DNA-binding response OmpR family regulator
MKTKILIVDDDKHIVELIRLYLDKEGCELKTAFQGKEALDIFHVWTPDLVVLDIMMPEMDGWDVCQEIRRISRVPVIMLTARGEVFDKVLGLELGADDYMVKPFDPKELIARVKAVLRRTRESDGTISQEVVLPGLMISKKEYTVRFQGRKTELPPKELELLYFLASAPNRVFTREQLLEHIWGYDFMGDSRTVDVHVKRLREKFTDENQRWEIKTVWGVGYKFEVRL